MECKVDFLTRVISTVVPAVVAECAKRHMEFRNICPNNEGLMNFAEKVSGEIVTECDFDVDTSTQELPEGISQEKYDAITEDEPDDLSHIQNLKIDLHELYTEFIDNLKEELIDTIRGAIKDELRMELYMELEKMRSQLPTQKTAPGVMKDFGAATLPQFSTDLGDVSGGGIDKVLGGFESVADKFTFNLPSITTPVKSDKDIERELLESNPLFAQISKNLDRSRAGKSMYTPDELIAARGERFGIVEAAEFKARVDTSDVQFDDSDSDEDERWDKLLRDKINASM